MSETPKRILVPLDLSPLGEVKLPVAEAQARAFGAELVLLHVLPPEAVDRSGAVSSEEARARTYLDTAVGRVRGDGVTANALIRIGPPAATIAGTALELGVDLIVLGSSVRAGILPRAFLGSVADEVVRLAPCPVLLVQPRLEDGVATPVQSFADDATRMGPLAQRTLGARTVEVSRIIGSVGRSSTLGANFRPLKRQREDEQRYQRVLDGMKNGAAFPPVELYKLGFGYYVLDGNHRVAAARELGQMEIEAEVTEFVPLGDLEAQRAFAERRAFERATGLTRVEAAHPDSYARLQTIVDDYGAEQGLSDRREAARRWYGDVWRPLARRIRQLGLTRRFPGDRSADILVRVAELRGAADDGRQPDWPAALEEFALANEAPGGGPGDAALRRRSLPLIGRRSG
jgi:nucleotide-binding universal stress UspA family protein